MAQVFRAPEDFEAPVLTLDDYRAGTWQTKEADYIERLADRAKMNGTNPLLGKVIRFQRGDGFAQYMLWSTKPVQLIWLELGDAWQVEEALTRGLRLSDIREQVEREQRLREFFAAKAAERDI